MNVHERIAAALAALCIVMTAEGAAAQRVGYIETIHGTVFLKTQKGVIKQLSPMHDLARLIDVRDRVRAERGGWIRIQTGSELLRVAPGKDWREIPRPTKTVPWRVAEALEEYGRTGGRSRSDELRSGAHVIAPAGGSAVAAHRFTIEVIPGTEDCPLALELRDMNRTVLWSIAEYHAPANIDASMLRGVMEGLQADTERIRLELQLTGKCAESMIGQFKLLSRGEEADLEKELSAWDEATNGFLLSRLGRASVFARYDLYPEVAAAYEEALRAVSDSIGLLKRTIQAHDRTGNVRRKAELAQKLSEIEPLAD